jgi:CO dehydrogenase/acetyl-CoA synthase beta subunit
LRKVIASILDLGINVGETIDIKLVDIIGNDIRTIYENKLVSFSKTITISNEIFEIELYENDKIKDYTRYVLSVGGINFRFRVPTLKENTPHELCSLIQLAGNDSVCTIINDEIVFEKDFLDKLELEFTNKEPYFTENQRKIYNLYIFYSSFYQDLTLTSDMSKALDLTLSKIGEV